MKIIKYTGEKTFMYPNGHLATPEAVKEQYPAVEAFPHIVETDENEQVMYALQNLSAMRSMYKIDPSFSEEEAIEAINQLRNIPVQAEPSAEERIAAALEYQVLMAMPDEI